MDQEFVNITNTSYEDILHPPIEILNAVGKPLQTFLITLYSFTAIFSFAGNITVICVMIGGRRSSRDLRYLLTNLALSDIMMAIFCIPFTYTEVLLNRWIFSIKFCPIVQFLQHCTVTSSVYTLTVIGIDRFYAVMYPLKVSWIRSHTILVIFGIWLMSAAFSVYVLISTKVEPFDWGGRMYYQCIESDSKAFAIAAFLLAFFIPLIILAFCYTIIAIKLYRRNAPGNVDAQRDQRQNQTKIKILKMLVLIVALFGFCWLPLHVFSVLVHFFPKFTVFSTEKSQNIFVGAYFVLHWIAMSHSFANPLIYSFMCENFRKQCLREKWSLVVREIWKYILFIIWWPIVVNGLAVAKCDINYKADFANMVRKCINKTAYKSTTTSNRPKETTSESTTTGCFRTTSSTTNSFMQQQQSQSFTFAKSPST